MPCCLMCFSDEPHEDDHYGGKPNKFQVSMKDATCKLQPSCCLALCCAPCYACYTRYTVLDGDMSKYRCCQGVFDGACCGMWNSGSCCEETCPWPCMCLEHIMCLGPAASSSRIHIMNEYELSSDPMDRQFIRFSNCLFGLSIICEVAAILDESFKELSAILNCISEAVFYSTLACMMSQTVHEHNYQKTAGNVKAPAHMPVAVAQPMDK